MITRRGRPPLTQEELQQRIDAYCARYGVVERKDDGLPPYPAGERESRQHRDWIVLYKAVSRFRKRQAALPPSPERQALDAQAGRCPVCLGTVGADGGVVIVHSECDALLRMVLKLGPSVLDRLRNHLWPDVPPSKSGRSR